MSMPIKLHCPIYDRDLTVYCVLRPEGIYCNRCEQSSNAKECKECDKQAVQLALEKLREAVEPGNPFFNEP